MELETEEREFIAVIRFLADKEQTAD